MHLAALYPPVALATIANVLFFACCWRGHKIEKETGTVPWWMIAAILVYAGGMLAFIYFKRGALLVTHADIAMAAVLGQMAGVAAVYSILNFFYLSRELKPGERVFAFAQMLVLTGVASAGFVA